MLPNNYTKGMPYELFIRDLRSCTENEYGSHRSNMSNLLDFEQGINYPFINGKQLLPDIKEWMKSAIEYGIKQKKFSSIALELKSYLPRVEASTTSAELLKICNDGSNLLQDWRTGES
jgi:hypothetical protein